MKKSEPIANLARALDLAAGATRRDIVEAVVRLKSAAPSDDADDDSARANRFVRAVEALDLDDVLTEETRAARGAGSDFSSTFARVLERSLEVVNAGLDEESDSRIHVYEQGLGLRVAEGTAEMARDRLHLARLSWRT